MPLGNGGSSITARDVARLAGVSQATVSRVLHNHDSVTTQTRQRVLEVLAATGYQPNVAARTMRTRRSGTIGLVVDDVTNPFYPELIQALAAELGRAGMRMILWDGIGPGEQAAIEAIDQRLVDGLVFTTATPDNRPLAEAVRRRSPMVLVNRTVPGLHCDQVDSDNRDQADAIARYFAGVGHQRVALIDGPHQTSTARERAAGYRAGCAEYGLTLDEAYVADGRFSHDGGRAAMARILDAAGDRPPTAVFCVNDVSALGALDELHARGLRVPDDLWVAGYDDIPMASWHTFGLTTVRQPLPEMAAAAIQLLLQRIQDPAGAVTHKRFGNGLVIRRSTGGVPFDEET